MITKTSSLLNYVDLGQIHPLVISNIIEPLNGIINSDILIKTYRKQALLGGKNVNKYA